MGLRSSFILGSSASFCDALLHAHCRHVSPSPSDTYSVPLGVGGKEKRGHWEDCLAGPFASLRRLSVKEYR